MLAHSHFAGRSKGLLDEFMLFQNTGCVEERPAYADEFVALLEQCVSLRLRFSYKLWGTLSAAMRRMTTA
jgi:hypothetical protein